MENKIKSVIVIIVIALTFTLLTRSCFSPKIPSLPKYTYTEEALTLHDGVPCRIIRYINNDMKNIVESWTVCDFKVEFVEEEINIDLIDPEDVSNE